MDNHAFVEQSPKPGRLPVQMRRHRLGAFHQYLKRHKHTHVVQLADNRITVILNQLGCLCQVAVEPDQSKFWHKASAVCKVKQS